MLSLEKVREIAAKARDDFGEFDHWAEYKNCYVFSVFDDQSIGGFLSPFIVSKHDGSISYSYAAAIMNDELGNPLSEGAL